MSLFENRLGLSCKQLGEASSELMEWIDDNAVVVGNERVALLRSFYGASQTAQRLASAVNAMSTIAFAGPRRAGKSQLMSSLVEGGHNSLALRFDGIQDPIGFMRQIVPDGGRLGTSAVIRLSAKSRPAPQNFPVAVRLVSLTDLVKITASAFIKAAHDRASACPDVLAVRGHIEEVSGRLSSTPVPGLREDDVWELRDYFASRHGHDPVVRVIAAAGLWEFLAEQSTAVTVGDKARLLSLLWSRHPIFDMVFQALSGALARLGHGREASCALDAIVGLDERTGRFMRRPDSILSANTLSGLVEPAGETVVVRTELGQWVSLTRCELAALISEVRLPVKGYATELLEKADLIELPSIESQDPLPGFDATMARQPDTIAHLFMKAKAVMLMERYCADSEITSLVLCLDPVARKLGDIPRLVADWVAQTHGATPGEREPNDNGLFVVFTKLDRDLTDAGRRGSERRAEIGSRIASALKADLARDYRWPLEWTPDRPFDNVFLVRSPAAKLKLLCEYDTHGREVAYKTSLTDRIERARAEFLGSDLVRQHVADPAAAWAEAMELNDGGLTYLAHSLAEACDMRVKHRQIHTSLNGLRQRMKDSLQRYYVSDNPAVQQSRRRGAALQVVRRIRQSAERQRLGGLINALQPSESDLADVLLNLWQLRPASSAVGDLPEAGGKEAEARLLSRSALVSWIDHVRSQTSASTAARRFNLPPEALACLVDELIVGAQRLDLEGSIAARIEATAAGTSEPERRLAIAAACAASLIGEFVMWLGAMDTRSNTRPRRKGRREIPIFPPRVEADLAKLEDDPDEDRFFADWAQAFIMLVTDNGIALRERDLSADENRRLGQLLMLLDSTI